MENELLIKGLYQKSLSARIASIEQNQQLITPNNREVVVEFIKSFKPSNNVWYNVTVVELAEDLNINEKVILDNFISYLTTPNHYLLKLAILDYIESTAANAFDFNLLNPLLNKNGDRLIVQNHARLLLLWQQPTKREQHFNYLAKQLRKTSDYRSHIRTYNFIQSHPDLLSNEELNTLIDISKKMDLGRGVKTTIDKLVNS